MLRHLYTPDPAGEPPAPPPSVLLALFHKAISTPDTLTSEDRRLILERLPEDEENDRCKVLCGLTMTELIHKAVQQPHNLTGDEADILLRGPGDNEKGADAAMSWLGQPEEVRLKRHAARAIAETETEKTARLNAQGVREERSQRKAAALSRLSDDDKRNIRYAQQLLWVSDIEAKDVPQWGFLLFRTSFADESAWHTFKEQFLDATTVALVQVHRSDRIAQNWKIQWVEDRSLEGASLTELCRHFHTLCSDEAAPKLLSGLHRDAFLYANADTIASATLCSPLPERGYVCAVDAAYDESKLPTYQHGFAGMIRVALTHVFTTFQARLVPRGDPQEDPSATQGLRQSWDLMYYKSRYDRENRIYPPSSVINR